MPDFGSFVMKSIATVWNGSPSDGVIGVADDFGYVCLDKGKES